MSQNTNRVCPFCDALFYNEIDIKKHIFHEHLSLNPEKFEEGTKKPIETSNHLKDLVDLNSEKVFKTRNFQCDICSSKFIRRDHLKRHHKNVHGDHKKIYCEFCGKYINEMIYHKHSSKCKFVFDEKYTGHEFQCNSCRRSYKGKDALNKHVKAVHEKIRFTCDLCSQSFVTKRDLKYHHQAVHLGILQHCEKCEMKFKSKPGLRYHMRTKHPENAIQEPKIDPTSIMNFQMHIQENIETEIKSDRIFSKATKSIEERFESDSKINAPPNENDPMNCDMCEKSFVSQRILDHHLTNHHNSEDILVNSDGNCKCDICGKSFSNVTILKQHGKIVHKQQNIHKVGNNSQQSGSESIPVSIVKLEPSISPIIFQKSSSPKSNQINEFMNCEFCGKDIPSLRFSPHIKTCQNEYEERYKGRKYQCKQCRRSIDFSGSIRWHRKIVHEKMKFPCEMCPTILSTKQVLQRHVISFHTK